MYLSRTTVQWFVGPFVTESHMLQRSQAYHPAEFQHKAPWLDSDTG